MGQALYRKHRPKRLSQVVGQEHVTKTLVAALKAGRLSHAYLFTGPRGVGKTSVARILAHEANDLKYDDDQAHIDIVEIDAASNRRIDEIRDLRDKVYIAPVSARYKIYIIDEVHMLTREAFNALLKTLEEPPAHIIFILATTELHKLPPTIVSRTQRFGFRPIEPAAAIQQLKAIAKTEKISVDDDALKLIAEHGDGSFRDSISLLDQAAAGGDHVSVDAVERLLGVPPKSIIASLARQITGKCGTAAELIQSLDELYAHGYPAGAVAKQLAALLRQDLLKRTAPDKQQLLHLLERLIDVPAASDPKALLEIVLLEHSFAGQPNTSQGDKPYRSPTSAPSKPSDKSSQSSETAKPAAAKPKALRAAKAAHKPKSSPKPLDDSAWPDILAALKAKHNTLYGVARMAQPHFGEGTLELAFKFAFHAKRLSDDKNRRLLAETVEQATGQALKISCVHDTSLPATPAAELPPVEPAAPEEAPVLATVNSIFGGGELLKSVE